MSLGNDPPTHATDLIGTMLAAAKEIGLDEHQVASLSRMYWSSARRSPSELVKEAAACLSSEQFGKAVACFAEGRVERRDGTASIAEGAQPADIDAAVAAALDKRIKDRSVVEVELASKVADRLIGWSKTFGVFVAAPVGVLLLILSLFGLSKFDDVRQAANRADDLLRQATTRLDESNTKLTAAEKRAADLTQLAAERAQDVDRQLAALRAANAQTQTQIASLGQTVQKIETQLGGLSAQEETGNKPPGFISTARQPGSSSYGTWGMSAKMAGELVAADGFPWHEEFSGLTPGSAEFDQAWRTLGERETDGFREQQRKFIELRFFEPAVRTLSSACGLDVRTRSQTLQDVVWAMAVQTGPQVRFVTEACRALRDAGQLDTAAAGLDERLIRDTFQRAVASSGERLGGALQRRYEREMRTALEQLAAEQARPAR
jgi:Type VI secretion system spike protein VgrG3-like, C-terminal